MTTDTAPLSLLPPLASFDAIGLDDLNRCLTAWEHKMGPLNRPGQEPWAWGLRHDGRLVAVTAASRLPAERVAGLSRADAFELSRVCAAEADWCRVALRLWRQAVFPALSAATGCAWAISYQDAVLHTGNLYRHDGWTRLAYSHSGTDRRSGRPGRDKWVWGWHADPAIRAAAAARQKETSRAA
ncbi:hypothetical protein [Azospirillum brasilense]|uniref:hypothetical protein n=1 Tax=Azospirillum brasilense TaxID=192 RepID=UPI001B3BE21F|nr:hypothetical protein [Azospirillum brasilense]